MSLGTPALLRFRFNDISKEYQHISQAEIPQVLQKVKRKACLMAMVMAPLMVLLLKKEHTPWWLCVALMVGGGVVMAWANYRATKQKIFKQLKHQ